MPETKESAHWGFRRVKWGTALGRQDLPNLILTIGVAVALAVIHWTCTQHVTTVFIQVRAAECQKSACAASDLP